MERNTLVVVFVVVAVFKVYHKSSTLKKTWDGRTDKRTDRRTGSSIEGHVKRKSDEQLAIKLRIGKNVKELIGCGWRFDGSILLLTRQCRFHPAGRSQQKAESEHEAKKVKRDSDVKDSKVKYSKARLPAWLNLEMGAKAIT